MVKTKDKLYDTADTMKPYVDRALHDDDLHDNLKEAFKAARDVYAELLGNRNLSSTAMRVGTDKEIQENLRKAVDDVGHDYLVGEVLLGDTASCVRTDVARAHYGDLPLRHLVPSCVRLAG
jgi:hypothetical protein